MRFSHYLSLDEEKTQAYLSRLNAKHYVDILAFALLPNHFHLLLRQNKKDGISNFVSRIENSYVRYFNTKNSRKGPLFEASFYAGLVEDDEQFRKRI